MFAPYLTFTLQPDRQQCGVDFEDRYSRHRPSRVGRMWLFNAAYHQLHCLAVLAPWRQLGGQLDIGPGPGAVFSVTFCLQVFPPTD
jgi:hypothetical protein